MRNGLSLITNNVIFEKTCMITSTRTAIKWSIIYLINILCFWPRKRFLRESRTISTVKESIENLMQPVGALLSRARGIHFLIRDTHFLMILWLTSGQVFHACFHLQSADICSFTKTLLAINVTEMATSCIKRIVLLMFKNIFQPPTG